MRITKFLAISLYVLLLSCFVIPSAQTSVAGDQIIITEVLYDKPGTDSVEEGIELYKSNDSEVNITGWSVADNLNYVEKEKHLIFIKILLIIILNNIELMRKILHQKRAIVIILSLFLFTLNPSSEVIVAAPDAPEIISPANGSVINDRSPFFNWTDVPDADMYHLLVLDGETNDTEVSLYVSTSEYDYYEDLEDGDWNWYVRANDSSGLWSLWSDVAVFTIDTVAPGDTTLLAPANGTISSDMCPDLTWEEVEDAFFYNLQLKTADLMWGTGWSWSETIYYWHTYLQDNDYIWRVRAVDEAGNIGSWSAYWYYILDTTSPVVVGSSDIGINVGETAMINWNLHDIHPKNYSIYQDGEYISGGIWNPNMGAINIGAIDLLNGIHEFVLFAEDQAGNIGFDSIIVSVYPLIPEFCNLPYLIIIPIVLLGVSIISKRKY